MSRCVYPHSYIREDHQNLPVYATIHHNISRPSNYSIHDWVNIGIGRSSHVIPVAALRTPSSNKQRGRE
jgi:hypothetical protein